MVRKSRSVFREEESGAVAAVYALSLFALIGIAGVGYDYARMAGMHSELQNAADQAALAGASQLDEETGACSRAAAAAANLLTNKSLLGELDNGSLAVKITNESACDATGKIRFWQDEGKTTASTSDANANFIEVFVNERTADYALTPIIGLFSSGGLDAAAMAGLASSLCKVPPVMMCNPAETTDPAFTTSNYVGKGIRLIANDSGGLYGPGVFGYLETGAGNGAIAVARVLGNQNLAGDCIRTDAADVEPGAQVSVLDALNTRMGVYANGLNNVCGTGDVNCPPAANSRIDLVRKGGQCAIGNNGFQEGPNPYRPTDPSADIDPTGLDPMGFPRDKCHAVSNSGSCTDGTIGDGNWDRAAYYATNNLGTMPTTGWKNYGYAELTGRTTPTRYQQYRWEYENSHLTPPNMTGGYSAQAAPLCNGPGLAPASTPDRRVLSVAVINCTAEGVGASTTDAKIGKFVDVFLVEPSARRDNGNRTEKSDVYVEVIGETTLGGGSSQGQEVRKDVPYLVR